MNLSSELTRQILLSLHLLGLALGMGAALVSDFSFFRSLKMSDRITPETVGWMRSFSVLVWVGIGLLALSGTGMFFQDTDRYLHSSGFLAKMLLVVILVINGLLLNFYTTARLTTFNFSEKYKESSAAWWSRKLSFVFGAISMMTWYFILAVSTLKSLVNLPVAGWLLAYGVILAGAITGSLILEKILNYYFRPKLPVKDLSQLPISALAGLNPQEVIKAMNQLKTPTQGTEKTIEHIQVVGPPDTTTAAPN